MIAIVMAKVPHAGAVKRRLTGPDGFDTETAADIAAAMLRCVVRRLAARRSVVLAVSPDNGIEPMQQYVGGIDIRCVPQGPGDLGQRMQRVWQSVAPNRPAAFFGTDSPDMPIDALAAVASLSDEREFVIGPTHDGGYWTIGGLRPMPVLFDGIDWGGPAVYDQTMVRAQAAGLHARILPTWSDVDHPADVAALQQRLERSQRAVDAHDDPSGMKNRDIADFPVSQRVKTEDDAALSELAAALRDLV